MLENLNELVRLVFFPVWMRILDMYRFFRRETSLLILCQQKPTYPELITPTFHNRIRELVGRYSQGVPQAELLYQFLLSHGIDAFSINPGEYVYVGTKESSIGKFLLVQSSHQRRIFGKYSNSHYFWKARVLEVFDNVVTELWFAVLITHELQHAWENCILALPEKVTKDVVADREIAAYAVSLDVVDKATSGRLLEVLEGFLESRDGDFFSQEYLGSLAEQLDPLFGNGCSDQERFMRWVLYSFAVHKSVVGTIVKSVIDLDEEGKETLRKKLMRNWYFSCFK